METILADLEIIGLEVLDIAALLIITGIHFIPAILAYHWNLRLRLLVAILNILLGWTGFGWLALVGYALWKRPKR